MTKDKQLCGIRLAEVREKRRWDQALNAKEFAVVAGVSYSTAREWFRAPGFPVFRGVVFWQDFVQWRTGRNLAPPLPVAGKNPAGAVHLPPQAQRMLSEA